MIDLTTHINHYPNEGAIHTEHRKIQATIAGHNWNFNCHHINMETNSGTHINFPSHIDESGDSFRSGDFKIADFWMIPTTVIHVDLAGRESVNAEMIQSGLTGPVQEHLILHALGKRNQSYYPGGKNRPWLDESAVKWLLAHPFRILTSDILEYTGSEPEKKTGVCPRLYEAHRCIIFGVRNLHRIKQNECTTCIIPLSVEGLTQVPCRIIAATTQ
jgi:kynurenine formamidase